MGCKSGRRYHHGQLHGHVTWAVIGDPDSKGPHPEKGSCSEGPQGLMA